MDMKQQSKRLSYLLRHAPNEAGLELGDGGWVEVDALLNGLDQKGWGMSRHELADLVENNDKKRFTISHDGQRIRAAQGHSVAIKPDLIASEPPERLFHGTATRFLQVILANGLQPMSRQHVHLSLDIETAKKVGQRHGKPVILNVAAGELSAAGQPFYQADNGVWLTGAISKAYLTQISET